MKDRGVPRKVLIGGWPSGKPTDLGWLEISASLSGPSISFRYWRSPRPLGKSPNRGRSSRVMPEVMRVSMPPESSEGHQRAIEGPGQRTGAVYDPLQNAVEVEAPVDAKAGLAQPGEAVPQRLIFSPQLVGFFERDARPAEYLRFCDSWLHVSDYTTRGTKET